MYWALPRTFSSPSSCGTERADCGADERAHDAACPPAATRPAACTAATILRVAGAAAEIAREARGESLPRPGRGSCCEQRHARRPACRACRSRTGRRRCSANARCSACMRGVVEQALERAHRPLVAAVRQRQAGAHRHAVDRDGAGAADALVAAALGGGQVQLVAQHGEQASSTGCATIGDRSPLTSSSTRVEAWWRRRSPAHAAEPLASAWRIGAQQQARNEQAAVVGAAADVVERIGAGLEQRRGAGDRGVAAVAAQQRIGGVVADRRRAAAADRGADRARRGRGRRRPRRSRSRRLTRACLT